MPFISVAAMTWLVLLRTFSTALDPTLEEAWKEWRKTHMKIYSKGKEEAFRRTIWEENLAMVKQHNREAVLGKHTYRMGMNQFSDWTDEEFDQRMSCFDLELAEATGWNKTIFQDSDALETPKWVDWRTNGHVTQVKDQGKCGSCWAFSATGALEAFHFKNTGKLVSLSEQNLIDCARKPGEGCEEGYYTTAFKYVQDNKGINSEETYPYEGEEGLCRYQPSKKVATCTDFRSYGDWDETHLEKLVATVGPISVSVNANCLRHYESGILYSESCSKTTNHAMLVVGYVSTKKNAETFGYWILKNSWGTHWGRNGYGRIAKGAGNQGGIGSYYGFPV
ncbi:procathepsin L-like [Hemicordylus capensis]|uniref:procathepsin L-like n=1 Tax=Hemicordylus capensis TaxID=884348 RepID=UPI002302CD8C|nr:procathepsin L-like [Hemicordylus capensis]XP_053156906.1 procathepsin L-like [Hemicordylus capensis]XP_053156907.1 procathepsin L-like [Hemicordylus capensis]XP_053156908.1 procathepsin L-like [Hemicordylus capensis]XP_053156909.1 procathepsin L-like [Hemicordylus capensis]XP_053156911.1 procathepsin L-like [Hemicordylus capensis]XP_053156912.1 procathepsin L-like [Hemicordylus capensis]XP_053156913.1 procathepsin L-like [Hemicordylus capensis]